MVDVFCDTFTLITGASTGIGEQFARQIAARRGNLMLVARSRDKLEALAAELSQAHGVDVRVIDADLSTDTGIGRLLAETCALGMPIDHLVSNAGFGYTGALLDADPERQTAMVRLNCEAVMRLSRHFLPGMVARGSGGVIHVASTSAFQPVPYFSTYAATKAFVLAFSCAIGEEVRASGVRVMALCPGPVRSGFQEASNYRFSKDDEMFALSAEETVRRGLAAYERRDDMCVTGALNRVVAQVSRVAPRRFLLRQMAKAFVKRVAR